MGKKTDVRQGTLALMILKTLEAMGPQDPKPDWKPKDFKGE